MRKQRNYRQNEQDMDQKAGGVKDEKSARPQDEKNERDHNEWPKAHRASIPEQSGRARVGYSSARRRTLVSG